MRIAFFSPHSDPLAAPGEPDSGGQCVYEARVATTLVKLGHEVRTYTRLWGNKSDQQEIIPGAQVYRFPMGPEGFLRKEDMGPYLAEFTNHVITDQEKWLASTDLFHGHYWDGGVAALNASLGLGKPLIFTTHSLGLLKADRVADPSPDGSSFRYQVRIPAEAKVLGATDRVIALSVVEKKALVERYGVNANKISIVPGGVDVNSYTPKSSKAELKRHLGVTTDFMLFTVGRLDPRKGFLELIEAVPLVIKRLQEHGKSATFLLPSGPKHPSEHEATYLAAMEERVAALHVEPYIRWFPRLTDDEMISHYAAADVFLCPSPYEPFGLVLIEAFSAATPVVATPHGGPSEIVSEAVDGFLADPGDAQAFGGKILDILLAPEKQRETMNQSALKKAEERYDWSAVGEQIATVYESCLSDLGTD